MNDEAMKKAREIAAQCWCDAETSHIEMDVVLAEAFAKRLAPMLAEQGERRMINAIGYAWLPCPNAEYACEYQLVIYPQENNHRDGEIVVHVKFDCGIWRFGTREFTTIEAAKLAAEKEYLK